MGPLMGFLYGWTLFIVIQTGTIAAVAVAFGRFLGVLWPAITPDRFGWFPQFDVSTPGGLIEVGLTPQRLVALITVWILTWINLRGVREGKLVQTTLTDHQDGRARALILLGLTIGRNADAIAANFGAGNFVGNVDITSTFMIAFGASLVGSLFSSDAWNNVTFAAAEVKNPQRNLPLALLMGTGLVSLLYILANVAYLNVLPLARNEGSGDCHRTRHSVRDAGSRGIGGSRDDLRRDRRHHHGDRDSHLDVRMQQRADPLRRARLLRDGEGQALLQEAGELNKNQCRRWRSSCRRSGRASSASRGRTGNCSIT